MKKWIDPRKKRLGTFKEEVEKLKPIKARYKPLEKNDVILIPKPGYGRILDAINVGREPVVEKITVTGKSMVAWVKEHVVEDSCKKCGSEMLKVAGMDTDTAWVRCNGCGNITEHDLEDIGKEANHDGERK